MIKKILSQLVLISFTLALSAHAQQVDLTKQVKGVLPSANGGAGTVSGIVKANGSGTTSAATAGTDYLSPPSGTSILKANSGGALSNATSGTDYAPATSGTSILYGNGSGGFSNVTIGTNLTFTGGTLNATGGGGGGSGTVNANSGAAGDYACYLGASGTTVVDSCPAPATTSGLSIGQIAYKSASNTISGVVLSGGFGFSGGTLSLGVTSGTSTLGTGAISSGTCATVVTTTATGALTTDVINWTYNSDPTGITGFAPTSTGSLKIIAYPTAGNVNFKVCNDTNASITPGSAVTLNWKVLR